MKHFNFLAGLCCALVLACTPADQPGAEHDSLTITSEKAFVVPAKGGNVVVSLVSSGVWAASLEDAGAAEWLRISPKYGTMEGRVTLLAQPNTGEQARNAKVIFSCGGASASVTVTQEGVAEVTPPEVVPPSDGTLVYYEDMDKSPGFSGWMDESSWRNPVGEGAAQVSYDCWNAKVRSDNYGSTGSIGTYTGASGKCYGRLTQSSNGNFGNFTISNISTCGYRNFTFSFGAAQGSEVLTLEASPDGSSWTELDYSFSSSYNHLGLAVTSFSVGSEVSAISLRFTLVGPSGTYQYGANIDDLRLMTAEGPSDVVIGGGSGSGDTGGGNKYPYAELPEYKENADYHYNTLHTKTVSSKKSVRNYSFCYDTRRKNPIWVAFPMHSIYTEGSGRSKDSNGKDPWMKYPDLPLEDQSIIWDITGDGRHQYWTASGSFYWGRGHLCMSGSREGAGSELNLQTFYPVNITPQASAGVFSDVWGQTETFHYKRGTQICSDTLYVVAGCHYANDNNIEYDAAYGRDDYSSYSKRCVMPTHQYKVFLRTRSGKTGKPVQECSASELKAIGFWMDTYLPDGYSTTLADYAVSVAEIERQTGLTFFPDIPDEVKSQCVPTDWGL